MKNIWKISTACLKSKADENINLAYRNLHIHLAYRNLHILLLNEKDHSCLKYRLRVYGGLRSRAIMIPCQLE